MKSSGLADYLPITFTYRERPPGDAHRTLGVRLWRIPDLVEMVW